MTDDVLVRVGKARRIKRMRVDGDGFEKGRHVVVRTDRGTEIATLVTGTRSTSAPAVKGGGEELMRLGPREFWRAVSSAREEEQLAEAVGVEPDRDVDASSGDAAEERVELVRLATAEDVDRVNEILEQDESLELAAFGEEIDALGLPMKPIQVEHLFGGERILFHFTSEGRVDFRALVKRLSQRFHKRVELRRIHPRDAAAMLGGIGVCGREVCCATHLVERKSVSIRMARAQDRPVSADSNLGQCGRLRCCLRYEVDSYKEKGKKGCSGCSVR